MTTLRQIAPILPVRDLAAALEHYRRLGFEVEAYAGADFYGYATRDDVSLHLALVHDLDPSLSNVALYLYVDDADALAAEWAGAGTGGTTNTPEDTEYGLREGAHIDPDGNLIRFGSALDSRPPEPA